MQAVLEPLLLTATRVLTFEQGRTLTSASGFFFERDARLYLVTSRHVMMDAATGHHPDRIEIELHVDAADLGQSASFSIPLYRDGTAVWRQGRDADGDIDVAVVQLDRGQLPRTLVYRAFTPRHLRQPPSSVEVGSNLLIVGFPLGFHDALHHMPVVRHAVLASSFGLRFQGHGYFLTDARTHRGTSGAPVVMRVDNPLGRLGDLHWVLLGVHSARLDQGGRDGTQDEALGLNSAWYVDILQTLTARDGDPTPRT